MCVRAPRACVCACVCVCVSACVCVRMERQLQQEEAKKMLDAMKDDMYTVRCIHDSYVRY